MSWEVIVPLGIFISFLVIANMYDKHKGNKTLEQEIAELKEKSKKDLEEANKRKRLELLEKFKQITETENELNELLYGYRDNNIIFNLGSLIRYLEEKEIEYKLETITLSVRQTRPDMKLTIKFSVTKYTVFIRIYKDTNSAQILEILEILKNTEN